MSCVIMYSKGKFKFKYGGVKFEVKATPDNERLFDVLGAFLILEKIKKDGLANEVEWQAMKNMAERTLKV